MTTMENTRDKNFTAMKWEAQRINNLILAQKKTITWKILKCHKMLSQFKLEQQNSTSTLKEATQEFDSNYREIKIKKEVICRKGSGE